METELKIDHSQAGHYPVLDVSGEVDGYTYSKFREAMLSSVDNESGSLIVSLQSVDYIDSSGLGALVAGLKRVSENNGKICIVCTSPQIRRIFEITGLKKVFPMFESIADARVALESGALASAVDQ